MILLRDGNWHRIDDGHHLAIGEIYHAKVTPVLGRPGVWNVTLNGSHLAETTDLDYGKAMAERTIAGDLQNNKIAMQVVINRAPPSEAIWGADGWVKWKKHLRETGALR